MEDRIVAKNNATHAKIESLTSIKKIIQVLNVLASTKKKQSTTIPPSDNLFLATDRTTAVAKCFTQDLDLQKASFASISGHQQLVNVHSYSKKTSNT